MFAAKLKSRPVWGGFSCVIAEKKIDLVRGRYDFINLLPVLQ
jgi:hypothetical protein